MHTYTHVGPLPVPVQPEVLPGHIPGSSLAEPKPEERFRLHPQTGHHHQGHVSGQRETGAGSGGWKKEAERGRGGGGEVD